MNEDRVGELRLSAFGESLEYIPGFLNSNKADELLSHCLKSLPWNQELVQMFGKTHVAPRLSCAVADEGSTYRYRGSQMTPIQFTPPLDELRTILLNSCNVPFNYLLATKYRSGEDYVGWHSDDERDLVRGVVIANISLGCTRLFRIKSKDGVQSEDIATEHGSLLLMHGDLHHESKHMLSRTKKLVGERVVLSFRQVA